MLEVVILQLSIHPRYQKNLNTLLGYLDTYQNKHIIVAPEVCLTGFHYAHIQTASKFSTKALGILKKEVQEQILVLTLIVQKKGQFFNQAVVIHKQKIIHKQEKVKLFSLGNEHQYFQAGQEKKIKPFEIDGLRYALLICFELRFKTLWKQVENVDIILIPSRWGKGRKNHLEILSSALAVMNQCFVLLSNASDEDMASSSAIVSPFGNIIRDDSKEAIEASLDLNEIKKMRRYIRIKN